MKQILVGEIKTLLTNVSEQISNDNLQDFIHLQLKQNSIIKTQKTTIFYSYLKNANSYFIASVENLNKLSYIEPLILKVYYDKNSKKGIILFIALDYFAIYEDGELIFFKAISDEVEDEQIVNFVENSLKFDILEVIKIDQVNYKSLQNEFENNIKKFNRLKLLKNKKSRHIKSFILFCLILIFTVIGLFFYRKYLNKNINIQSINSVEKPFKELVSSNILNLIYGVDEKRIELVNISLQNSNNLDFTLRATNKDTLIEFLEKNKNAKMKTLFFNGEVSNYELNSSIRLP